MVRLRRPFNEGDAVVLTPDRLGARGAALAEHEGWRVRVYGGLPGEEARVRIVHVSKAGVFAKPWAIYQEGVRVGVEAGTTGALFAERELPDAQIQFFVDAQAAFAGLRRDAIDVYIHDAPTSWMLATTGDGDDLIGLYHPLTEESLAWAVRKTDQRLLEQLNEALQTMRSSGTLRYILNRWIPVEITTQ